MGFLYHRFSIFNDSTMWDMICTLHRKQMGQIIWSVVQKRDILAMKVPSYIPHGLDCIAIFWDRKTKALRNPYANHNSCYITGIFHISYNIYPYSDKTGFIGDRIHKTGPITAAHLLNAALTLHYIYMENDLTSSSFKAICMNINL